MSLWQRLETVPIAHQLCKKWPFFAPLHCPNKRVLRKTQIMVQHWGLHHSPSRTSLIPGSAGAWNRISGKFTGTSDMEPVPTAWQENSRAEDAKLTIQSLL